MKAEEIEIEIAGKLYRSCGTIGSGAVGHVCVVKDQQGQKYALKIIRQYGRNPIVKMQVDQEIEVQKKFNGNPHIIQIYASRVKEKKMYIVLELGSCSLRIRMNQQALIQLKEFIDIALDTTKGLQAIHSKNLIHRDIKPENIICSYNSYKISDFGSLKEGTSGQGDLGTTLYLPPEILFDIDKSYDQKIDVWSLGVSLFQAYFRIHPFYYSKQMNDRKKAQQQMKENIKALTPNFTMQKFLSHILKKQLLEEYKSVVNKIEVTPKDILDIFSLFFKDASQREDIEYFNAIFQSLQESCRLSTAKSSRITVKKQEIPSDILFFVQTLNLFYELCSKYGNNKKQEIQFHLELGMWYWNYFNYNGYSYVQFSQIDKLKKYLKKKQILWEEVQSVLLDYYLELSSSSELSFYQNLQSLKLRILICAANLKIYNNLTNFLKAVSNNVQIQIKNIEELPQYFHIFETVQFKKIEDLIINQYIYKS